MFLKIINFLYTRTLYVNSVGSHIGRNIIRYRSIVSWPKDGCMMSRNMSPRTK